MPSKDDPIYKQIANLETINILITVLQIALPSITNPDLIQEIQTMSAAKAHSNLTSTRPETIHSINHPFTAPTANGLPLSTQLRTLQSNCVAFLRSVKRHS